MSNVSPVLHRLDGGSSPEPESRARDRTGVRTRRYGSRFSLSTNRCGLSGSEMHQKYLLQNINRHQSLAVRSVMPLSSACATAIADSPKLQSNCSNWFDCKEHLALVLQLRGACHYCREHGKVQLGWSKLRHSEAGLRVPAWVEQRILHTQRMEAASIPSGLQALGCTSM